MKQRTEERKEYDRLFYLRNKEKILKRCRERSENKTSEEKSKYYRENLERCKRNEKLYRQRNRGNLGIRLRRIYKLTVEEFDKMTVEQNGYCKICNKHISELKVQKLVIDHCHITGKVRGLLCNHCNTSLGGFRDNIEVLKRAIDYLNSFK